MACLRSWARQQLTDEILVTLMAEEAAIVNARPLTGPSDTNDPEGHLSNDKPVRKVTVAIFPDEKKKTIVTINSGINNKTIHVPSSNTKWLYIWATTEQLGRQQLPCCEMEKGRPYVTINLGIIKKTILIWSPKWKLVGQTEYLNAWPPGSTFCCRVWFLRAIFWEHGELIDTRTKIFIFLPRRFLLVKYFKKK